MKKNSNIELFRIVCMLLILFHHSILYSGCLENSFGVNKMISILLYSGGKFGANCFFSITAWFLIDAKLSIKRIIKIWITTFMYGIIFLALNYIVGFKILVMRDVFETILPITFKSYWYVTAYMGVVFLSPILNKIIYSITINQYKYLLLTLFIMISVPATFVIVSKPFQDESHFLLFVLIYFIIGFAKRNVPLFDNKKTLKAIFVGGYFSALMCGFTLCYIGHVLGIPEIENHATVWMNGESIPMVVASISASVLVLKHFKPFHNEWVNRIARGNFDVYLIHMNHFIYLWIWNTLFCIPSMYQSKFFFLLILVIVFLIYIILLIVGNIRYHIFTSISGMVHIRSIDEIIERIQSRVE